jgi:hypothetical protein
LVIVSTEPAGEKVAAVASPVGCTRYSPYIG